MFTTQVPERQSQAHPPRRRVRSGARNSPNCCAQLNFHLPKLCLSPLRYPTSLRQSIHSLTIAHSRAKVMLALQEVPPLTANSSCGRKDEDDDARPESSNRAARFTAVRRWLSIQKYHLTRRVVDDPLTTTRREGGVETSYTAPPREFIHKSFFWRTEMVINFNKDDWNDSFTFSVSLLNHPIKFLHFLTSRCRFQSLIIHRFGYSFFQYNDMMIKSEPSKSSSS